MKTIQEEWDIFHKGSLYKKLSPRYKKSIDWILEQYINLSEDEDILEKNVVFVSFRDDGSLKLSGPKEMKINRRRLLNLDALDFDYGLYFQGNYTMPFFGNNEIGLFRAGKMDEIENGDICVVQHKPTTNLFLATKEETGFFYLNCNFLGTEEDCELLSILVNVETR